MTNVDLQQLAIDREQPRPSTMRYQRHFVTRYALPALLIVGFLSLVAWASRDFVFPPESVTVVPVHVSQSGVSQEGTPLFNAAGWIEPRPTPVRVAALAPGVIEQLLVVEDQPVEAGEPIAEMIKDDAKLAHDAAVADEKLRLAELAEAQAELRAAETRFRQPVHLEAILGESEAALAEIETQLTKLPFDARHAAARLEFAKRDYQRNLDAKNAIAVRVIDESKRELEMTQALADELRDRDTSLKKEQAALRLRRDALKTQLELLADEIRAKEAADAKVMAATARVEQARVAVAEAKLRLDRMTVRAPIAGRVYRLIGHPGARIGNDMIQMVGHDSSTVVTLYRPEMLQVRVDTRFENIPQVRVGQTVEITNAAIASPVTGEVLFVSSEADIQKNTLQVKVAIDSPPSVFKPEMLVDVTFMSSGPTDKSQAKEALVDRIFVPRQIVRSDGGDTYVWLADVSANAARKQFVQTGSNKNGLVEVTNGLTISSRLITSGTDRLTDGCRIRVTGEDTTAGTASNPSDT